MLHTAELQVAVEIPRRPLVEVDRSLAEPPRHLVLLRSCSQWPCADLIGAAQEPEIVGVEPRRPEVDVHELEWMYSPPNLVERERSRHIRTATSASASRCALVRPGR